MLSTTVYDKIAKKFDDETFAHYFFNEYSQRLDLPALKYLNKEDKSTATVLYKDLYERVVCLSAKLYQMHLEGKNVAIVGQNSYQWVELFFAFLCSNVVTIPLDSTLGSDKLLDYCDHCDIDIVFSDSEDYLDSDKIKEKGIKLINFDAIDGLVEEGKNLIEQEDSICKDWYDYRVNNKDYSMIMFTSGTGGKVKAATFSHENFTAEMILQNRYQFDIDCFLVILPFYHMCGINELLYGLMVGTCVYISGGIRFLVDDIIASKAPFVTLVPVQARILLSFINKKLDGDIKSLFGNQFMFVRTVGAPLTEDLINDYEASGINILSDYGMTETTGWISLTKIVGDKIYYKKNSVGQVLDNVKVRLKDPDTNNIGELFVKAQNIFLGYYNDEEETRKILNDGWLNTGDMAFIDDDNFLFLKGRKKNVIILDSGENIVPEEIEDMIMQVDNVEECIVYQHNNQLSVDLFSKTDSGEQIKNDINEANKSLPAFKRVTVINVLDKPLPRTSTGKIKRTPKA